MVVEERLRSKLLYKLFLASLKYIPVFIAISYILNTALYWFDIDLAVLSNISGMSLFTWLFMYIATYVFQFCEYHRLLLYYIILDDLISIYDYYFIIPIDDYLILSMHTILVGFLVISLLIVHVKNNKKNTLKFSI